MIHIWNIYINQCNKQSAQIEVHAVIEDMVNVSRVSNTFPIVSKLTQSSDPPLFTTIHFQNSAV